MLSVNLIFKINISIERKIEQQKDGFQGKSLRRIKYGYNFRMSLYNVLLKSSFTSTCGFGGVATVKVDKKIITIIL